MKCLPSSASAVLAFVLPVAAVGAPLQLALGARGGAVLLEQPLGRRVAPALGASLHLGSGRYAAQLRYDFAWGSGAAAGLGTDARYHSMGALARLGWTVWSGARVSAEASFAGGPTLEVASVSYRLAGSPVGARLGWAPGATIAAGLAATLPALGVAGGVELAYRWRAGANEAQAQVVG